MIAKARTGICRECGGIYQTRRASREFCCTAHRQAFHNRRMMQGKQLIDLVIAWRFDRADFKAAGGLTALCRMISKIKTENDCDRKGNIRIWDRAGAVKYRNPYLAATVIETHAAGMGRRK